MEELEDLKQEYSKVPGSSYCNNVLVMPDSFGSYPILTLEADFTNIDIVNCIIKIDSIKLPK